MSEYPISSARIITILGRSAVPFWASLRMGHPVSNSIASKTAVFFIGFNRFCASPLFRRAALVTPLPYPETVDSSWWFPAGLWQDCTVVRQAHPALLLRVEVRKSRRIRGHLSVSTDLCGWQDNR